MSEKYTPGPWKADRNLGCKMISAKPFEQHRQAKRMEIACTSGIYSEEEDAANARLMAAAPELLAALRLAVALMERQDTLRHLDPVFVELDQARAAIANADPQP